MNMLPTVVHKIRLLLETLGVVLYTIYGWANQISGEKSNGFLLTLKPVRPQPAHHT